MIMACQGIERTRYSFLHLRKVMFVKLNGSLE